MICPPEYYAIANAVLIFAQLSGSMTFNIMFGIIARLTHSYQPSILMMIVLVLSGLFFSLFILFLDVQSNGPLHKSSEGYAVDDDGVESEMLSEISEIEMYSGENQKLMPKTEAVHYV